MKRLLLPGSLTAGQRVELTGSDYHYLVHVLRYRIGGRVRGLDASGATWNLELVADDGSRLVAVAHPEDAEDRDRGPRLTLYQAIPKGNRLDDLVRGLVQFGVRRICPIVTERTVVRTRSDSGRVDRWQRIAREAVQQSDAPGPVEVLAPRPLSEVQPTAGALSLVLHTEPLAQTSLHGYLGEPASEIDLVVGPEGGFTGAELTALLQTGFKPLWLGPQVLRSESAALFAAAAVRILILERTYWQPTSRRV
jgi:16S rRNA (uracil1498-N3)-methyltransferase